MKIVSKILVFLLLFALNLSADSNYSYQITKVRNEIKNENYQPAVITLKRLITQTKDKSHLAELYFLTAECEETSQNAKPFYEKVLNLHRNDYTDKAKLALAKNYYINSNNKKAELYLKDILQHPSSPSFKDAVYWAAQNYFFMQDYTNCINYFNKYIAIGKDDTMRELSMLNVGTAYFRMNNFSAAIKQYQKLKSSGEGKSFLPFLLYMMGLSYEKISQYDKAVVSYKQVINQYPYSQQRFLAESQLVNLAENGHYSSTLKMPEINTDFEKKYAVQLSAFLQRGKAKVSQQKFEEKGYNTFIYEKQVNNKQYFAVGLGPYKTEEEAKYIQKKLKKNGISSFIYKMP